ncbi:MAG: ribosome hibernation promoting factor [Patescibacteria group bacterium]|nr:MAG: ribosome hibernation promoting factor [Patescibacteria group bacterium]
MKNINVKATNIELTPAISAYVEERVKALDKFIVAKDPDSVLANVEVGKVTQHHRSGDIFRAEINLHIGGEYFRAVSEKDDLYAAIDEMRDEIVREITSYKKKKRDLLRKGSAKIKKLLKGIRK